MQEQPPETRCPQPEVEVPVAVLPVPGDRMAERRAVDADLVGAARMRKDLRQGHPGAHRDPREVGHRFAPCFGDPHHPFASGQTAAFERQVHPPAAGLPPRSPEQRHVPLVEGSPAQRFVEGAERAPALGDDEAAGGVPVEPVRELEIPGLRPGGPQQLDRPVRDPAPAVDREAGRLVQNEQPLVLVEDCAADRPDPGRRRPSGRLRPGGRRDRRDPHRFSRPEASTRPRPRAVHPDLAPAQQPVQAVAGDLRQLRVQEVVDPAAVVLVVDRHAARGSPRPLRSRPGGRPGGRGAGRRR